MLQQGAESGGKSSYAAAACIESPEAGDLKRALKEIEELKRKLEGTDESSAEVPMEIGGDGDKAKADAARQKKFAFVKDFRALAQQGDLHHAMRLPAQNESLRRFPQTQNDALTGSLVSPKLTRPTLF